MYRPKTVKSKGILDPNIIRLNTQNIMKAYERYHALAEGYNVYAIVGALLFGFGVTAVFEYNDDKFKAADEDLEVVFMTFMAFTIMTSASSTLIMTTQ